MFEEPLGGKWLFDGNANDSSGNGNNGVVFNATLTTGRKGAPNTAYFFDSNNDRISIPYSTTLFNGVFSYSAWIYPTSFGSARYIVNSWVTADGLPADRIDALLILNVSGNDRIELIYNHDSGISVYRSSINLFVNTWYHVVAVHGLSADKIYINGTLDNSAAYRLGGFNAGIASGNPDMVFGESLNYKGNYFGKIDDAYKYTKELSQPEVTALYNE